MEFREKIPHFFWISDGKLLANMKCLVTVELLSNSIRFIFILFPLGDPMKKLLSVLALALTGVVTLPAHAVGTTEIGNFSVKVSLTPKCKFVATSAVIDFGNYQAFVGPANATPATDISFACTNGLTPSSVTLDTTNTVVNGLAYTLAVTGGLATGGSAGNSTSAAVADTHTYTVTGTMATGQAGTGSGAATIVARVLTVTY